MIDETAARPVETAWLTEEANSSLPSVAIPRQSASRTALAGLIGNVIEWFDFAVYGYFATDIGRQFFPQSSGTAQQLLAFTVFALGFVARPIGSIALGVIGDRLGRLCFKRRFSSSSCFSRCISLSSMPPYFAFQR